MLNKFSKNCTLFFLIFLLFILVFCFDESILDEPSTFRNICVPYINMNITIALFVLSFFILSLIMFSRCKLDFNSIVILLIIRIPLYFIPIFYVEGDFKIGIAYAIIQCLISLLIGLTFDKRKFKRLIYILMLSTIVIGIEVFYTLLNYNLSFFSSNLKWYMALPMGKSNYISCIVLPIFYLVDMYLIQERKYILSFPYTIFIGLTVLGTGSKWGLFLYFLYLIFKIIYDAKNNCKKNILLYFFIIISIIISIYIFDLGFIELVRNLKNKYSGNIFYDRIQVFNESFDLFSENIFLGRSAFYYQIYDSSKAHNFILESLIQTGIIGTILYITALVLSLVSILNISNKNIRLCFLVFYTGYLVQGLAEPNLFGSVSDGLFWLIIGIALAYTPNYELRLISFNSGGIYEL